MIFRSLSLTLLAALLVSASPAAAQVSVPRICDNCSAAEKQACASMMARYYGLRAGDMAWTFDFAAGETALFLIEVRLPEGNADARERQTAITASASETVKVTRQPLTDEQAEGSDALIQLGQALFQPESLAFNISACGPDLLDSPEQAAYRRAELQRQWDQRIIRLHKDVPAGVGPNSIHDILGNLALAMQLAHDIAPPSDLLAGDASSADDPDPATIGGPNATLRLDFADGSVGVWRLASRIGKWIPDWTLFMDSDMNSIPLTAGDLYIGMGFSFSSRTNLEWFLEHTAGLGIPIDRDDDADGHVTCVRDYRRLHCQPRFPQG